MLRNTKALGLALIACTLLFTGCNKTTDDTQDNTLVQENTDTYDEADNELEKPAEEDRITIELAVVKDNIYNASLAPTLNRASKDTTMEKYNIQQLENEEQVIEALKNKTVNMAVLDVNSAAKLYNETKAIKILATNTLSNLYVTSLVDEADEPSGDLSALNGKTVYMANDNSAAQTIIEYALKDANCQIEYVSSNDEIVAMIEQGQGEYFAAPEPYHTSARLKNSHLSLMVDLGQAINLTYPTSCIVANADFVAENEAAMIYILDDHLKSIKTTVHAPTRTVQWAKNNNMTNNSSYYLSTMQNFHFTYYDGTAMAEILDNYYAEMCDMNKNAVNEVPDTDIYYIG